MPRGTLSDDPDIGDDRRLRQLTRYPQRNFDLTLAVRDIADVLLGGDQLVAESLQHQDSSRQVDVLVHVEPAVACNRIIGRLDRDVMRRDARAGELERQAGLLDIGIGRAEERRMVGDDRGGYERADSGDVVDLVERLRDNVDADELAVAHRRPSRAIEGRLYLVELAAAAGDLDLPGQDTANSLGRFGLLRLERFLHIEIVRAELQIESWVGSERGYARRPDRTVKGAELQRFDRHAIAAICRRQREVLVRHVGDHPGRGTDVGRSRNRVAIAAERAVDGKLAELLAQILSAGNEFAEL